MGATCRHALTITLGNDFLIGHCQLVQQVADLGWQDFVQYVFDCTHLLEGVLKATRWLHGDGTLGPSSLSS